MKKNILPFIIWAAVCCSACQNEIPFDIKDNPPKLALHTLLESNTDKNEIYLSWTGRDRATLVNDPVINIYVNNELKDPLLNDLGQTSHIFYNANYYTTGVNFSPGDRVKVEVFADNGKHHAWAEDVIPQPVEIEKVDTMTYTEKTRFGTEYKNMRIKITFTDNPNEKNYYRLTVQQNDTVFGLSPVTQNDTIFISKNYQTLITREDFVLTDGQPSSDENNEPFFQTKNQSCIFDDTQLNGTYTMTVGWRIIDYSRSYYLSKVTRESKNIIVGLSTLTEWQYYYLKAINIRGYDKNSDFLTQPISFPDNIQGGVGFFGLSTTSTQTLKLPDYIPEEQE
jgi:hypothetical protein